MIYDFDMYGRLEKPSILLCNPDGNPIYSLKPAISTKITLRFNALSEIEIILPNRIDDTDMDYYPYLSQKRLIKVGISQFSGGNSSYFPNDFSLDMYFVISSVVESDDGLVSLKTVKGYSQEYFMGSRRLTGFSGTLKFHDVVNPENGLMGKILERLPGWTLAEVDTELLEKYRTFDVSDLSIYNFLTTDVSNAYQCLFLFDNVSKKIYARSNQTALTSTSIQLSHENLVEKIRLTESDDEITTVLHVYGGGDLDIRTVNPLGTTAIYNFDYYKNTDWMTSELIDAITLWETKIDTNQPIYASKLTTLKTNIDTKITLENELADLQAAHNALEATMAVKITAGESISDTKGWMDVELAKINTKNNSINAVQDDIDSLKVQLAAINSDLSFDTNFTVSQQSELEGFIFENTYQNSNFIQTDAMTDSEIQEMAQELYDLASTVLETISAPRYTLEADTVSMIALEEYKLWSSQLNLGSQIRIRKSDGTILTLVLLELLIDYENPKNSKMKFSNRLRLDGEDFIYTDLFGETVKTGSTVNFGRADWSNWSTTHKDDVTNFITSTLIAANNAVADTENQQILIYENGLKARTYDEDTETYGQSQLWLTANNIVFTNDGWLTADLAIGKLNFNGTDIMGVAAGAIVGNLIAGNTLYISNEANNFTLDADGATLENATLKITNSKADIYLNPTDGIKIQTKSGGSLKTAFQVDSDGNLEFAGNLSGASGTFSGRITANEGKIGGFDITSQGLEKGSNLYIKSNGDMRVGALVISGNIAQFHGTIYADNINGQIGEGTIKDGAVTENKLATFSADKIYGGTINWPGARLGTYGTGRPYIEGDDYIRMMVGAFDSYVELDNTNARIYGANRVDIDASQGMLIETYNGNLDIDARNADVFVKSGRDVYLTPDKTLYIEATDVNINGLYGANIVNARFTDPYGGFYYVSFKNGICYRVSHS